MKKIFILISLMALLTSCVLNPPQEEKIEYTVNFLLDEEVVSTEVVEEGHDATAPVDIFKVGYTFIGWDKTFNNVVSDLDVNALFIADLVYYEVKFFADGELLATSEVLRGDAAIAPSAPVKTDYIFRGWDKSFHSVKSDLEVNAIFEEDLSNKIINYTSYVESLTYNQVNSFEGLLNDFDYTGNFVASINDINFGGFRKTNQIHYYNSSNLPTRNSFGFEVGIDAHNVVIARGTLVSLPLGGYILSGHGDGAEILQDNLKIGDIVVYGNLSANYYRKAGITEIIQIKVLIDNSVELISESFNGVKALNYVLLQEKMNQMIDTYNALLLAFDAEDYDNALALYMDIAYLSVEGQAVMVKGYWHYPLRNSNFTEKNTEEVSLMLDQVKTMGFNRIYLNTNFGGYAVYKSSIISQRLTNYNTYEGYKDYLECFVSLAHLKGIEVYAWTNTLIAGDGAANAYYSSRGWINIAYNESDNYGGMYFIDIANPDARAHVVSVLEELATYNLDGIEYDFIRYPNGNINNYSGVITDDSNVNDSGYTTHFIDPFMLTHNLTGDFKEIIRNDEAIRTAWYLYKRELLSTLVFDISTAIRVVNPDTKISAAVMPSITTALNVYNQDWKSWIRDGLVDILDPMIYTSSRSYLESSLSSMQTVVGSDAFIVVGIFPESSGADNAENAYQIDLIMNNLALGFSKFSSKVIFIAPKLMNSLSLMNRHYTVSKLSPLEIKKAYAYDFYDKVNNFYKFYDSQTDYESILAILEAAILDQDFDGLNASITTFLSSIENVKVKDKLTAYDNYIVNILGRVNE